MRFVRLFIILFSLLSSTLAFSQISHGGTPYFLQPSVLRASSESFFIEMPAFDLDSILRKDAISEESMRENNRFAYKFYTRIDSKDAIQTVLQDGTVVKQIGIRSAGAYSINLLFSDFEIPPGGKLFIYSADHSYVVGSFDYRNNSPSKLFPIQPVAGESIVVEYSEPANAPFTGRFIITEVNHDYRDFFRREPDVDKNKEYDCMPDVFCDDAAEEMIRSTVLLIVNGTTFCTGSLLNNTENDGKPYLLTAVHCFCNPEDYPKDMDYYESRANTIVAFFNYNRPVCDATLKMKGSEEMSLAGTSARVILEKKDIALLEFNNSPPEYFNPYFAGWNRSLTTNGEVHINLHHPSGTVKKYGMTEADNITIGNAPIAGTILDANSYWIIPYWTIGSTHEGSSGSPLFDENQYIIGGLTGGSSRCSGMSPDGKSDFFSALGKGWETDNPANQLKSYLDPADNDAVKYPGMDPNTANPVVRLANASYTGSDLLITSELDSPNEGFVFGNSNLKTLEFAEEFTVPDNVEIFGTYLLLPPMPFNYTSGVQISVYTGNSSPEKKIYSTGFIPRYVNYSTSSGFYQANKTLNSVPTETFVLFEDENQKPVSITTKKFFISYSIDYSTTSQFCVYNTNRSDNSRPNTAWLKDETKGWVPADSYEFQAMKTSLAIQPLVRKNKDNRIEIVTDPGNTCFYYDRSGRLLTLKEPLDNQGQLTIYSVGGLLLEKIQIPPGQTVFMLNDQPKGTIGIVKIADNSFNTTGKMMY